MNGARMYSRQPKIVRFDKNETSAIKVKFDSMFPGNKWTVSTWQNIYPQLALYPVEIQEEALFILLNSNLKYPPSPSQFISACKDAYTKVVSSDPEFHKEKEPDDFPQHTQSEHAKIHGFSSFNAMIHAIKENIYDYRHEHKKLMANDRAGYITRLKEIRNEVTKDD